MSQTFTTRRRVEFCETDSARLAHFSSFFLYMEQAEHALLREAGLSVVIHDDQGTISWPRVHASCDYEGGAKFEDVLEITVHVERLGAKSVAYAFAFDRDGCRIARGKMTSVCCRLHAADPPRSIEIPAWIADKLRPYCRRSADA